MKGLSPMPHRNEKAKRDDDHVQTVDKYHQQFPKPDFHMGWRIFYVPTNVNNTADEEGSGWFTQIADGFAGSDAIGPYHTAKEAIESLSTEFELPEQSQVLKESSEFKIAAEKAKDLLIW